MAESHQCFTTFDGLRLFERRWLPANEALAALVVIHGFTEHGGRYAAVAEAWTRSGFAVYAPDLRGHGRSDGPRVFVRSFDEYLTDVELYLDRVRGEQPGKPLFLLGFSMGGTIVARLAALGRAQVRGVVLCAPALVVDSHIFPLLRRLAPLASAIIPRVRLVRLGSTMISRDPQVVADFRNDPLVFHGRFPTRTGAELLRVTAEMQGKMQCVCVPLLVLHGTADAVTDPQGSRDLVARAASADKTLKIYDGCYHDLLNEPEKERIRGDLLAWLQERARSE